MTAQGKHSGGARNQVFDDVRTHLPGLVVFIAYAGLACITTWPLMARMTTYLGGRSHDALLHYWNGWWVQQALREGISPFYTSYLFYPNGLSLVTHNIAWFNVLPWLVLAPLLGGVPAYNLVLLLNLSLCGGALYVLTRRLTGDPRAAFLAGLIYQTWPYRLSQLDHPNLLSTYWVPIFFLFFIDAIRGGRWRDSLLAGLSYALIGYTRWQQLIAVTPMALVYFACSARHWWPKGRRYIFSRLIAAGSVAVVALLPPALLLLDVQSAESCSINLLREGEDAHMQTDILTYLTPWTTHPVFGRYTQPLYDRYYRDRPRDPDPTYVGIVALSLAWLGIRAGRWRVLGWVLMAVLLISLALGPVLRIGGHLVQVPTLYGLLSPLVGLMRDPDRFNVFLALPVSVLAAYGIAGWSARLQRWRPWSVALIPIMLGGLVLFDSWSVPVPAIDVSHVPSFYAQIAQEPGDFAVMNFPSRNGKDFMFEQTYHRRPILRGNISRLPEDAAAYIDDHPGLGILRQAHNVPPPAGDVGRFLSALAEDEVRYIIAHKRRLGEERTELWRRYFLIEPRYEDERVMIYSTTPRAGRDYVLMRELAPGLGPIQVLVSVDCLNPGHVLGLAVGWGSTVELDRDFDVTVSLVDGTGVVQQSERYPLSTIWPTSQWPANAVAWEFYALRTSPSIPTGEYSVTLALPGYDPSMSVRSVSVQPAVCDLATVPEARDANALFGNELRLTEYRVQQEGRKLDLTLYWHAAYRMDVDYKIFVHVYDPATGIPVAQEDTMPRRWEYPTTLWWPGEVVEDVISISLEGVPAGDYGLAVGVYDPSTGERLSLMDGRGRMIADGRFVLQETVRLR